MLTLIGFAMASTGEVLAAFELWLLAGIVATTGSAFDMLDGAVARATGTMSALGAFMDSVFDRWGEGVVYVGIVIGATQAGLDVAAWLVPPRWSRPSWSATRVPERGPRVLERDGHGRHRPRTAEVRTVHPRRTLVAAGILGVTSELDPGSLVLAGGLALIAVLATLTVIGASATSSRDHIGKEAISPHERHDIPERHLGGGRRPRPPGAQLTDSRRHRRGGQLRQRPRPGPLLLRRRRPGRDRPRSDARGLGGYHVRDIEFVAAFDIDANKVGTDLSRRSRRAQQHVRLPAGPTWASRSTAA